MRITFELESTDIERFQGAFDRARHLASHVSEVDIVDAAKQALDAIMLELIARRMRHVLDAYRQFCAFRHALGSSTHDDPERMLKVCKLAQQRSHLDEALTARRERFDARVG